MGAFGKVGYRSPIRVEIEGKLVGGKTARAGMIPNKEHRTITIVFPITYELSDGGSATVLPPQERGRLTARSVLNSDQWPY